MRNKPRRMPRRFLEGAPAEILDIIRPAKSDPCRDFDILFFPESPDYVYGFAIGEFGHDSGLFQLSRHDAAAYRARCKRRRIAWRDLPEPTRRSVFNLLKKWIYANA